MKPVEFEQQDIILGPPPDMERGTCGGLPIRRLTNDIGPTMESYWKPSAEDLKMLNEGGHVRLNVYGHGHPPVWVDVMPKGYIEELP